MRLVAESADAPGVNNGGTPLRNLSLAYVNGRYRRSEIAQPARRAIDQTLRTLCDSFGSRPVAQLGPAAIDRWLETIAHLSPSTRRNHVSRVRRFCRWLVHEGKLRRDPTGHVQPIKVPRRVPITLSPTEIGALLAAAPNLRAKVVVAIMWDAGPRCAEVARLHVEDYSPSDRTLFFRGKGGHERVIPIMPTTAALIDGYLAELGHSTGPLLRSLNDPARGVDAATLSHYVRGWMRDAGVKLRAGDGKSAHALRRTCGSEIMEATNDIRAAQAYLGHADPSTTARFYLRTVTMARLREAMDCRHGVMDDLPEVA